MSPKKTDKAFKIKKESYYVYKIGPYRTHSEGEAKSYVRELRRMDWFKEIEIRGEFEVKPYHLELLQKLKFNFDHYPYLNDTDAQIGVPFLRTIEIRPGSGFIGRWSDDVKIGMAMGLQPPEYNEVGCPIFNKQQRDLISKAFLELKIVLEVVTACLGIETGNYRLTDVQKKVWQKV